MDLFIEGYAVARDYSSSLTVLSDAENSTTEDDDDIGKSLDLNSLIVHPAATFFMRVQSRSMTNAGIFPGDLLVVDRVVKPMDGKVIIARINGKFHMKRVRFLENQVFLVEEDGSTPLLIPNDEVSRFIWGVVLHSIHTVL